ncbi:D-2-hydroxyacid dehydrogenase [Vibrio sp. JC009]|uniref:D-2-hydroxyacid dehydrogenase n=1 Tax=Vibrio sp. JC009 TaxID=2912314 RepID=UPI0023B11658|nr:D-2-hydroxyacid dehydrogenase [Vibrio sp. JC009]WED21697.1 D-2-hydroxyacid dehydrogenase [Vibrio sp. JC009]
MDNFSNKLRILTQSDSTYLQLLKKAALPDLEITDNNAEADIVLAEPPMLSKCLDEFTELSWAQSTFAGVDALMSPGLRQDYDLTNVKGIFGQQISEYVLGYCIEHFRHFNLYRQQQEQKVWQPHTYSTLADKRLFILGTGAIGNYLAKAASAFNLHTVGINRTGIPPKESAFNEVVHFEQLQARLAEADILVSTLPGTPETEGVFNQAFFADCREALFFNVGRGSAVDTPALLEALEQNKISHAFLDVFINEPISQQCPYWHNPKVTVTPHIAAYSFPEQVFEIFTENYLRWRDGFQLQNRVDFDKGY